MTPSVAHLPLSGVMAGFRRFSVPEYQHLCELGILTENDDLELLEGYLVHKMARNPPHDGTLQRLIRHLSRMMPADLEIRNQMAVTLRDSAPEPDLAVVRLEPNDYMQRHPGPDDILMVAEVSDSSLDGDREDKCRIYARAGIPTYWIVNLVGRQIEVYTSPVGDPTPAYRDRVDRRLGDAVELVLEGRHVGTLAVSAVLG
jgi:Uma2 family endonuclease